VADEVLVFGPRVGGSELLFAKAVMRFEVERRLQKLVLSAVGSSLMPLCSVMSEWGAAT
jgi:hypothetical protein